MRFLATATAGSYDDPMSDIHPDVVEMFYGVDGHPRAHRPGRTGAGHSDDEEDGSEDEDVDMDDSDESGSEADSDDQGDISDDEESSELEGPLDTGSAWTDTDDTGSGDGDSEEEEEDKENLVYTIMNQQTPNVRHAAIKVPRVRNPFASAERLSDFLDALEALQTHNVLPHGLLIHPSEWRDEWGTESYPTWETLAIGRSRKKMPIDLPPSVWLPRAQRWCQAVDMLTRFQRDEIGMVSM